MERFTACCPENSIETVYSRCGTGSGGALVQSALLIVAGLLLLIVALVLHFTYYRCPHCSRFIATLYSDISGHFKAKCGNCKTITIFNLGYFRRVRRYGRERRG